MSNDWENKDWEMKKCYFYDAFPLKDIARNQIMKLRRSRNRWLKFASLVVGIHFLIKLFAHEFGRYDIFIFAWLSGLYLWTIIADRICDAKYIRLMKHIRRG